MRDFGSNESLEIGGILYEFPNFQTAQLRQKIPCQPKTIYSEVPQISTTICTKSMEYFPVLCCNLLLTLGQKNGKVSKSERDDET